MPQHIFPRDAAGRIFAPLNAVTPSRVKVSATEFLYSFYGWYQNVNDRADRGVAYQAVFVYPFGSAAPMVEVPLDLGATDRGELWAGDAGVFLDFFVGSRSYTQQLNGFAPYRQGVTVADVRGVVLEALRGLLFDVEAVRKLLRW